LTRDLKMRLLLIVLWLVALVNGLLEENATIELEDVTGTGAMAEKHDPARLVMYVQTFKTPQNERLSLLPHLLHHTRVTHVILASLHLHEQPGQIRLNDDRLDSPVWDDMWSEVKILQKHGIKVMGLLGGAAGGTYKRLNGTDKEVSANSESTGVRLQTERRYQHVRVTVRKGWKIRQVARALLEAQCSPSSVWSRANAETHTNYRNC
jgi:hypothetical protein